jgi:hypothetical protein
LRLAHPAQISTSNGAPELSLANNYFCAEVSRTKDLPAHLIGTGEGFLNLGTSIAWALSLKKF